MILRNTKLFLGTFILLAYVGIGIFGLIEFNNMSPAPMADCPYTQNGFSVCENVLDHIGTWQQFSNVIFSSLFIFTFLILGLVLYILNKHNFLNQQYLYRWKHLYKEKLNTSVSRIIKWLSLFENSPSLSYSA